MSERRVSTRVLSFLLVLCMVFGMLPASAITAFAADSTTATATNSVAAIREYAAEMLKDNFSKAASEDSGSKDDKFTWDTEGKTTNWRYYTGVMLDALLMLGVDSDTDDTVSTNSALEFAKDFMDTNTEDADKAVTHYITKEVDSVPPALVLFDLLDTAEVTAEDRAIYVKAINYVYGQLEAQTSYDDCGGNFLHKMDNESWSTWNIGLDGIYMAQPFLMEYAHALAAGKITNTVNSKTASDIYKEVYDRLIWIADTMYDEDSGLYHHGWNVEDSKGNGHFWSRGIGWYAAGLVMCIDLMPEGTYKTNLIGKLSKLFDGMIRYQDDSTGLWYNVVNRDSSLTDNNGNKLETSGTALMAYAMMKAVNEGWVDSKYATSALEAFNGIVSEKLDSGKIKDIYKSSGVCTDDASYCKNSYVSDEAKGIGGVIMAAAEVDKYLGTAETFKAGVVVAPDITVALNGTPDYSGVKISLVGSQGTIKNVDYSDSGVSFVEASTLAVGDTAGTVEVAVVYDDSVIDTFNVNVVDTTVPSTGEGTLGIETGTVTVPSNPEFTDGNFELIEEISSGSTEYVLYSSKDNSSVPAGNYIIVYSTDGSTGKALKNVTSAVDGGTVPDTPMDVTIVDSKVNFGTASATDIGYTVWTVDADSYVGNGSNYLQDGQNTKLLNKKGSANAISFAVDSGTTGGWLIYLQSGRPMGWGSSENFERQSSGTTGVNIFLFKETAVSGETTSAVYAQLTGNEGFVYGFGVASSDIIADIKASTAFKVLVANNAEGTDATEVAMSDSLVTVEKNSDYKNDEAKTNNFIVKYDGVQIGTIPVIVYDDTASTTKYDVSVSVTPGAVIATEGDGTTQLNATVTVDGLSGTGWSVKYSGGSSSVATVSEDGLVTIVGEGSTTITATVIAITYDGNAYDADDFGTITATIPVTVNAKADEEVHTHSYTGVQTTAPTCTSAGVMTYTCSCGDSYTSAIAATGHNYTGEQTKAPSCTEKGTMTYTCSNCGNTYTEDIAMTDHNYVDGKCSVCGNEDPDYVAPTYEYTILGADGNALSGQNVTLNEGETYTPTFSAKYGDEDVTGSYTMTLSSESTAITISGTTITANEVESDTVATVTATVAPNTRDASGTSVEFTVTVKAATTEDDTPSTVTPPTVDADTVYKKLTALTSDITYVVIGRNSSNRTATHGTDPGVQEAAWTEVEDGWKYGAAAHIWVIEKIDDSSNYYIYYMDGTTKYYLNGNGTNNLVCATTADTQWTVTFSGETAQVTVASGTHGNADNRIYLNVDGSNGPKFESSAQTLVLYSPVVTTPTYTVTVTPEKEAMLSGTTQTITASMLMGTEAVEGAAYTWSVTSGDATISGNGATATLTAGTDGGDVVISVTAASGENTATATATVTVQKYTVSVADAAIDEGKSLNLADFVTVQVNGETVTSGYTLVYTVDGETVDSATYTGAQVDANTEHTLGVSVVVDGSTVASGEATLTVYDTNFHDTDMWENKQTNTAAVAEGQTLTFTLGGEQPAGYWGFLDNLKLYKADGTEVSITNGDFESGTTGWALTGYSSVSSDSKADANKTNRLNLWISEDAATGEAVFTVTGLEAGEYYFKYDVLESAEGTVTAAAAAIDRTIVSYELGVTNLTISESDIDENGYVTEDVLKAAIKAANGSDKDTVTLTWTYSDGTTGSAELVAGSGQNIPLVVAEHSNGARYFGVWYNDLDYTGEIGVTIETAADEGFVLDTSGSVNWNNGEYIIVWDNGDGTYSALNNSNGATAVTITDGMVDITYDNAANIIWTFDDTNGNQIYNGDVYLRSNSAAASGDEEDTVSSVTAVSGTTGGYAINLGNNRYLRFTGSTWTRGSSGDSYTVYLYKWTGSTSADTVVPSSATVSPATVNVANSGTVDLSGVTMKVTMSDGTKKTIANSNLTYDVSSINTALAGTYTVPVSYTENGKTVTANVSVVVAAASSGGTSTSELWIHDFTKDGETDPDNWYSITAKYSTSYTGSYGDRSFSKSMKMESSTQVAFTAPSEGTFTLVFDSEASPGSSIYLTDPSGTRTSYTVPSDGVLTIDLEEGGDYLLQKKDGASYVFYMEYATALVDGITVTAPGTMYIAAANGSLNPTHEMQYIIRHGDEIVTSGYTIEWATLDSSVATISESGVLTAQAPGTTSVTAKATMEDGTEYDATVLVTVVGPGISTTEEMSLIRGEDGMDSGKIASTVYAGGVSTTTYELGYMSSDENVATVAADGTVTAVGVGTATIYTYIKSVNGITVYNGDGIDPQPAYFDSTAVTVSDKEITNATLNSYDYVVQVNKDGSLAALLQELRFEANRTAAVSGAEGVKLTIDYNTGSHEVIAFGAEDPDGDGVYTNTEFTVDGKKYTSNGITIDLTNVDITTEHIYTAPITYKDEDGNVIFQDTLWIHVEEYNPADYDGTLVKEDGVHYILHTGAFTEKDANWEYVIVPENADIAFKNPSETAIGSTTATTAAVVLANGQVESILHPGTYLYDGADVDYLTMSINDAFLSEWLLDTLVDTDTSDNIVQLNMSNFNRYIGGGDTQTQLIHHATKSVQLVTLDEETGESQIILGYGENDEPYYLGYVDGIWTATTEEYSVYLYYKDIELIQDYGFDFDLYDNNFDISKYPAEQDSKNLSEVVDGTYTNVLSIPDGFVYEAITPVIVWNDNNIVNTENGDTYTIVWSSSNTGVATVDQNGVVTAISQGEAIITATLYDINGDIVICNTHNTEHVSKTVKVEVTSATPVPVLTPDELTIGIGTMPNFSKVSVKMTFEGTNGEYDYDVPFDQLVFKLADATGTAADGTAMTSFDNNVVGTYEVPVTYAGDEFTLTIHVVEDPYAGLDEAESIPGYPDAGSVRMQKIATGVLDFTTTGVTKIELDAAGISTKSSVDVVLIVDVSNSMGWSMDWFNGLSDSEVGDATDSVKIPSNGADGTDKLDIAMETATEFADILLNVPGGDNTLTFVTFAGADRDHGGSSDNVDSVRTPMVGVRDYDTAANVFANTKFTTLEKDGTGAKYTLQIGGYDDDGYGEAQVSGTNRGNTNYDYAFGEAMDAIAQIKAKYAANNNGASYDESGRQIHVVFMTDGAPSHYNGQKGAGNAKDTLWDGSGDTYTTLDGNSEANWLAYIKNYNELATQLHGMVDGAYTVGFDMAHGGFGDYSYELADMQRVLEGLAKNTIVPATMAENEQELNDYMTSLARALAYAGTNAKVTDKIGGNFSLFTGVSMYSSDITDGGIMTEDTLNQMKAMSFPITVYSYRLVVYSDIDTSLSVINTDGSIETVTISEEHLGLRVNEEPEILEQITFSADGTQAFSDVKGEGVNIMTTSDGKRVIDAETFTYSATLDTMTIDGVEVKHAAEENIVWKIGNITDHEVSMQYYAYLDGSLDNPREAVSGVYATNEYAYLEYVDVNGDYVYREFGVPQIAWGKANVTVRFYLVNKDGEFVNRAGVTFTNPANRLFLDGRAQYEAELNNFVEFDAQDALVKAGLAASNVLYDASVHATVVNSTDAANTADGVTFSSGTAKDKGLLMYTDTSNGFFSNVVIDIPVVLTELGESDQKMADKSVVIDYGKEIVFDPFDATTEALYKDIVVDNVRYQMSLVGFANYNADHDLKDYVPATGYVTTLNTANGSYKVSGGNVSFTPTRMLSEVERVFAAIKFTTSVQQDGQWVETPQNDYYMYKLVNIIPATNVYYETDFASGVFTLEGSWSTKYSGPEKDGPQNFVEIGADDCYGYDSTYTTDSGYSNYATAFATGTALVDGKYTTTASFSFTGTGFDIISKTGLNDGAIVVTITQDTSDFKQKITVINKGENDLYQIPVISVEDLDYGTYNVEIGVAPAVTYPAGMEKLNRGGDFYFDAVRIYNPAKGNTEAEAAYVKDNEANTQYFEIRGLLVNPVDTSIKVEGVSYIDKTKGEATLADYATIGPNNELYIAGNKAIAFAFTWTGSAPTSIDIGAKSIISGESANLKAYISGVPTHATAVRDVAINSATAQFYQLVNKDNAADFSAINTAYVLIENTGSGVLSLTDVKVAFGTASATASIDFTVDQNVLDFANACATFGDVDEDTSGESTAAITQKGRTLSYEDMIYVIDIFELKDVEGIDLSKDAGLMVWSVEEYEALNGTLVFDEAHANAGLLPYEGEEGFYYGTSDGIFTRDLHEEAYYAGYVKQEDGSYIFSEAKLYSPAIYAYNMLAKADTSETTKNLSVALLNYISAAQKYFHGSADADLVNADLTAEQKALEWNNPELNLASEIPAGKDVARDSKVFTGRGKNLLFEEMISLVSVYKIDDAVVANAAECGTIFWTAEQFAALEGVSGVDNIGDGIKVGLSQYQGEAGQWASYAPAVSAKDMAETEYYILGYVIHTDGTVSYSGVMSYTFEQYIHNMADSAAMGEFAMRLYYYERAAQAALGEN